ncbi:hypothetical protein BX611_1309 [Lutibacter oceani]|uniref:Uncharacterized protein n=1 Tax=Lutibacter oceani TaxID=1853311 RepID=A0A3D9RPB9_9FLAO|nr:hypothetical protein BX611_1309 [Lutibacter oceani]
MKKITLLLLLSIVFNYNINAQDYNLNEITSTISKIYSGDCISEITVDFSIPTLLK